MSYEFNVPNQFNADEIARLRTAHTAAPQETEEPAATEEPVKLTVSPQGNGDDTLSLMQVNESYLDAVDAYERAQQDVENIRAEWKAAKKDGEDKDTIQQLHDQLDVAKEIRDEANKVRKDNKKIYEKHNVEQKFEERGIKYEGDVSYSGNKNAEYYLDMDDTHRVISDDTLKEAGFTDNLKRENFNHYTGNNNDRLAITRDNEGNTNFIHTTIEENGTKNARLYSFNKSQPVPEPETAPAPQLTTPNKPEKADNAPIPGEDIDKFQD